MIQSTIINEEELNNITPVEPEQSKPNDPLSNMSPEARAVLESNLKNVNINRPTVSQSKSTTAPKNIIQSKETKDIASVMQSNNIGKVQAEEEHFDTFLISLPSEGKFYPTNSSCYGVKEVEVRELLPTDEDILYSKKLILNEKVLDMLVKKSVLTNINTDELLQNDKFAILLQLRIDSYGADYTPKDKDGKPILFHCENCQAKFPYTFDLSLINKKQLSDESIIINTDGSINFTVPSKKNVRIKFITSKEEISIEEEINANRRLTNNEGIDPIFSIRLKYLIVELDGNTDKSFIKKSIQNGYLKLKDSRAIRSFLKNHMPEMDMKQHITCPECFVKSTEAEEIPITGELFYMAI